MIRTTFTLATLVASLAACATDSDQSGNGNGGGKADGDTELTTLTFDADWNETTDGPIVAGHSVRVAYDLNRLTECRGETNGSEVWGIGGFASFDGGEPVRFELTRIVDGKVVALEPELAVPSSARSVELWFQNGNRWGCNAYDSNENANYRFEVEQNDDRAVLAFEADGSEAQSGELVDGGQVVLHYDPARLSECAASSGGNAKWSITGHYKVDGGAVKTVLVTRANGADLVAADPAITIPSGASSLEVWFSSTSVYGCNEVDSDGGRNYHYGVN